jgi:hypothetical protein
MVGYLERVHAKSVQKLCRMSPDFLASFCAPYYRSLSVMSLSNAAVRFHIRRPVDR